MVYTEGTLGGQEWKQETSLGNDCARQSQKTGGGSGVGEKASDLKYSTCTLEAAVSRIAYRLNLTGGRDN